MSAGLRLSRSMTWQRVLDGGGGTVAGLCTASGRVFAATAAGVFESTDAGQGWRLLGDGQPLAFAEALTAAPDGVLFACAAGGLHRSEDGGRRWQQVLIGGRMLAVAAAAEGVVIAGSEADGVLRSDDGGRSWTGANAGLLDLTVLALALSPTLRARRDRLRRHALGRVPLAQRGTVVAGGRHRRARPCRAVPGRLASLRRRSTRPRRHGGGRTACFQRRRLDLASGAGRQRERAGVRGARRHCRRNRLGHLRVFGQRLVMAARRRRSWRRARPGLRRTRPARRPRASWRVPFGR